VTAKRLPIRMWRVSRAAPYGLHLWFDPDTERPRLYELEPHLKSGVPEGGERDDCDSFAVDLDQKKQMFLQEELPFDF